MSEETVSSYEMAGEKNSYQWVLEEAGATVHAFQDFGSYQGDWLAKVTYQGKTGWVKDYYGSCSGCDAFEAECDYQDRTREEWKKFAASFATTYLENIRPYEVVLAECKENLEWDLDAKEMVAFMERNK